MLSGEKSAVKTIESILDNIKIIRSTCNYVNFDKDYCKDFGWKLKGYN